MVRLISWLPVQVSIGLSGFRFRFFQVCEDFNEHLCREFVLQGQ
jgi:hypothetical protein